MSAEASLGGIVRAVGAEYLRTHSTTSDQRKALRAIAACRTPALGGHRDQCDRCGFEHVLWHSCRNRHCPRCQSAARAEWLEARSAELLPVPYFHVVFTVPESLNILALIAPKAFYEILFHAAGQTLTDIAASRLKVSIGALTVLHTWGQTLSLHPHIHCVVPGGGFSLHRDAWVSLRRPKFFLPVKVLSLRFRTLVCNAIREAWRSGAIDRDRRRFSDRVALDLFLAQACKTQWVAYSKAPFGGPRQVLAYLASYTHRIAISNKRIVAFDGDHVSFTHRDYRTGRSGVMRLTTAEFLRRFLLHVLPQRFVRIRYYGFVANRRRKASLDRARQLLRVKPAPPLKMTTPTEARRCPACREGAMLVIELVARNVCYWNDS